MHVGKYRIVPTGWYGIVNPYRFDQSRGGFSQAFPRSAPTIVTSGRSSKPFVSGFLHQKIFEVPPPGFSQCSYGPLINKLAYSCLGISHTSREALDFWHHKTHNQNPHKGHDSYQCIRGLLWKGSVNPWLNQMGVEYQPVDVLSFHQQKSGCFISFTSKSNIKSPSSGTCTIRFTFSFFWESGKSAIRKFIESLTTCECGNLFFFSHHAVLDAFGVLMRRFLGYVLNEQFSSFRVCQAFRRITIKHMKNADNMFELLHSSSESFV